MDLFQKNLQLWAKTCPREAVLLPYVKTEAYENIKTKKGEENLKHDSMIYHDPKGAVAEAEKWFKDLSLKGIPLICIYGVGLGYCYDAAQAWLKKDKHHRLVILEDDLAVIHKLFETERATRILQNSQVQLISFHDLKDKEVFETLYWNYSMTRFSISALNAYAKHKDDFFAELRHKIAYDANKKNALVFEYLHFGASYYINFYQNMLSLPGSYYGNQLFGKFQQVPAIICGAGPSLTKQLPLLKTLMDKALIFAGGSALNVLNAADIQPHFGVSIDPNPTQQKRVIANQAYEVPFFYRSRMNHQAFEMLHGPRLYITGAGGYDTAEYFEEKLGIKGEWLDEGHNVINFCVEVANALGCNPIIFVGMDLAYTGLKQYAAGVVEDATVEKSTILEVEEEEEKALQRPDIYGKPTFTLWKWIAEADWFSEFAQTHPLVKLINCTEGGIGFKDIPNEPLAKLAKRVLTRQYELRSRIHGEIENSEMPQVTYAKVSKITKGLSKSLMQAVQHLEILGEENQRTIGKIKEGKEAVQSGRAVLAETELAEEPAYKSVLDVFNEVFTRILSGDMHEISVGRYSEKQKLLKKHALIGQKFAFLVDAANLNNKFLNHAFEERKKRKKGEKIIVETPSIDDEVKIIDKSFSPVMIPKEKKEMMDLGDGYRLRVIKDDNWKVSECFVEKQGQMDGQNLLYYSNGKIKQESFYRKGVLHGPTTYFGEQGEMLAKGWYIQGKQEGKVVWYYPNGSVYSVQCYLDGVWHGQQVYYHRDGSIKTLLNYQHGKLKGSPILRNADGTKARVM